MKPEEPMDVDDDGIMDEDIVSPEMFQKFSKTIVETFCDEHPTEWQNLKSFERFMEVDLPTILKCNGEVEVVERSLTGEPIRVHSACVTKTEIETFGDESNISEIQFKDVSGYVNTLLPHEARIRNLTYARNIFAYIRHDICETDKNGTKKCCGESKTQRVLFASIPVMVKSKYCSLYGLSPENLIDFNEDPDDPGGYFIINGKERVIVTQEKPAINKYFVFEPMCDADYKLQAEVRSSENSATSYPSALWIRIPGKPARKSETSLTETKMQLAAGRHDNFFRDVPTTSRSLKGIRRNSCDEYLKKHHPSLVVYHANLARPIPLMSLFKGLGIMKIRAVKKLLAIPPGHEEVLDYILGFTFRETVSSELETRRDALRFIGENLSLPASRIFRKKPSSQQKGQKEGIGLYEEKDEYVLLGTQFINEDVLPHIGKSEKYNVKKAVHIGYMVCKLLRTYLGIIPFDDRDHLENKRFDLAGDLLTQLIRLVLNKTVHRLKTLLERKIENKAKYDFFREVAMGCCYMEMSRGINYSMSTGNWCDSKVAKRGKVRVGVSQLLNRTTRVATLSFIRRISLHLSKLIRMTAPRSVHPTGFGYICPVESPEGEQIGLVKNLALLATVSRESDEGIISEVLKKLGCNPLSRSNVGKLTTETKIIVNATVFGTVPFQDANSLVSKLRQLRFGWDEKKYLAIMNERGRLFETLKKREESDGVPKGTLSLRDLNLDEECNIEIFFIHNEVSIKYWYREAEIHIRTDAGRLIRPLFIVKDKKLCLKRYHVDKLTYSKNTVPQPGVCNYGWDNLISDGTVEYLDPSESENAVIAMTFEDLVRPNNHAVLTHCEIDPSSICGLSASLIPFANHNYTIRNSFQSNMLKQSVGVYALNFSQRYDTDAHILWYPQKPIVSTRVTAFAKEDSFPSGINAIVALCNYLGFNQEDSVILNRSSIERGLFTSLCNRTYTVEEKRNLGSGREFEHFGIPLKKSHPTKSYKNLEEDGLPAVGSWIQGDEILCGKSLFCNERNGPVFRKDISMVYQTSLAAVRGRVDSVVLFNDHEGYKTAKIRVQQIRVPEIGDKFTSRHGQKGILALIVAQEDMPTSKNGIVPDIIINPHAFPSRMSIGQLLEQIAAKVASIKGGYYEATMFDFKNIYKNQREADSLTEDLGKLGYQKQGEEVLYDGRNGKKINSTIFMGPCFYQRLKHMVQDKFHCRLRGAVADLTRQPKFGITSGGGLRFGEMERDAVIAHGALQFLRERLLLVSDYSIAIVCDYCGLLASKIPVRKSLQKESTSKQFVYKCMLCKVNDGCSSVEIPHSAKLLLQELGSMNIRCGIVPDLPESQTLALPIEDMKMLKKKRMKISLCNSTSTRVVEDILKYCVERDAFNLEERILYST